MNSNKTAVQFQWALYAYAVAAITLAMPHAHAHGIVGDRFFPATITTDDPFAADELALPTITSFNHETDYDLDYAKTIFPGFAVSVGIGYVDATPPGGPKASGWSNLSITPALELWRSELHEAIVTAGFIWDVGRSGSKSVADRASTYTPELLFGKGFGDLPNSMALLRPLAVTGQLGFAVPGTKATSRSFEWGGAVEYSLLYLQNNVRDQGFSNLVAHLTPIVEFALSTPTDPGGGGTTGTVNPGLFWSGQYTQLGVEAVLPVNHASGKTVGVTAQLHFYVDDILPDSLGRPIFFGGAR
jgi:hypothetical protein